MKREATVGHRRLPMETRRLVGSTYGASHFESVAQPAKGAGMALAALGRRPGCRHRGSGAGEADLDPFRRPCRGRLQRQRRDEGGQSGGEGVADRTNAHPLCSLWAEARLRRPTGRPGGALADGPSSRTSRMCVSSALVVRRCCARLLQNGAAFDQAREPLDEPPRGPSRCVSQPFLHLCPLLGRHEFGARGPGKSGLSPAF
jgi:hypothetical protein